MSLRKSRKILCFLLTVVMSVGVIISAGTAIFRFTICSSSYMERFILSEDVSTKCDESYNASIEALADDTGIPSRVYIAAKDQFIMTETVLDRIYTNQDASLLSGDKIEITERLCKEYLNGNNIKFDKNAIHSAAEKAASIYSQSYGISNGDYFYHFTSAVKEKSVGIIGLGLFLFVLPMAIMLVLFEKKERLVMQLLASLTATGMSLLLFSVAGVVFSMTKKINIEPSYYADAISEAMIMSFLLLVLMGTIATTGFVIIAIKTNKSFKERRVFES